MLLRRHAFCLPLPSPLLRMLLRLMSRLSGIVVFVVLAFLIHALPADGKFALSCVPLRLRRRWTGLPLAEGRFAL